MRGIGFLSGGERACGEVMKRSQSVSLASVAEYRARPSAEASPVVAVCGSDFSGSCGGEVY